MLKSVAIGLMCLICVLEAVDVERYSSFSEKLLGGLIKQNAAIAYSQTGEINPKYNFFNLSGPLYSVKVGATNYTRPLKIWGEGTESKFPPFLESILERVQSFYSVFKYEDLSRPKSTTLSPVVADEMVANEVVADEVVEVVSESLEAEPTTKLMEETTTETTSKPAKPEETFATTSATQPSSPLFTRKRITFVPVYFDSPPKFLSNSNKKPVDV